MDFYSRKLLLSCRQMLWNCSRWLVGFYSCGIVECSFPFTVGSTLTSLSMYCCSLPCGIMKRSKSSCGSPVCRINKLADSRGNGLYFVSIFWLLYWLVALITRSFRRGSVVTLYYVGGVAFLWQMLSEYLQYYHSDITQLLDHIDLYVRQCGRHKQRQCLHLLSLFFTCTSISSQQKLHQASVRQAKRLSFDFLINCFATLQQANLASGILFVSEALT